MLSVQGNILGIILFFFSFEGNSFANFPNKTNDKNRKINIFFHFDENDKFNLYHKGNEYIISYAWEWIKACGLMCSFAMANQWGSKIIVA